MSLVQTSVESVIRTSQLNSTNIEPTFFDPLGVSILSITIFVKSSLYIFCHWVGNMGQKNPSVGAYAEDHRNDVAANGCVENQFSFFFFFISNETVFSGACVTSKTLTCSFSFVSFPFFSKPLFTEWP